MRLGDWRRSKGWTQQRLADELECVLPTVVRYENGSRMPERDAMMRIYIVTARAVLPNDFYPIDEWAAASIMADAEAEISRKAA